MAALVAGIALSAAGARSEPIDVRYLAPERCPGSGAFTSELRARTVRAVLVAPPEALRVFEVSITLKDGRFEGRVAIRDRAGQITSRSFSDKSCAEVVSALSLVAALAIDPDASTSPVSIASAPEPSVAPPGSSSATPLASASPVGVEEPRGVPVVAQGALGRSVGGSMAMLAGIGPHLSLGLGVFGGLRSTSEALLSPSFQLGVTAALDSPAAGSEDKVATVLTAMQGEACPLHGRIGAHLTVAPCLATDIGILFARGVNVPGPQRAARLWWSGGGLARVRYATEAGPFVQAGAALLTPLLRYRFVVSDSPEIAYTLPPVVVSVSVGAGVEF